MIDGLKRYGKPLFLASVTSAEEARMAASGGADLIDCKDPRNGALGALEASEITSVVAAIGGGLPVSATVGDLPTDAALMVKAAEATAAAGANIVKVGFFGDGAARAAIAALGSAQLGSAGLVAVLMADREPDFSIIADLARAGFIGVMLDTAGKTDGALPDVLDGDALKTFIATARWHGLAAGLAGSLRLEHIAAMVALKPDIVGFRGALCDGARTGALDGQRVEEVRRRLNEAWAREAARDFKRSVA